MERPPLTPTQARILGAIREAITERGYPPTLREIGAAVGMGSSGVSYQIRQLHAAGYLRVDEGPRAMQVLDGPTVGEAVPGLVRDHTPLHRARRYTCPGCRTDGLDRIGITSLAYVFDSCSCGEPAYDHLIEQLWHRACLTNGVRP